MNLFSDAGVDTRAEGKVAGRHLDRLAVVYVRQSSPRQVRENQESARLQYGLIDRAVQLGWSRERVLVIDDDQARTGINVEGRPGFHRLVAEVSLDHVGLILGFQVSRLSRSCADWHRLLELCAVFDTLLGDLDGIYDPTLFNDQLVLDFKGTFSAVEHRLIKQRLLTAKNNKAGRGELAMRLPMGYVRRPSGEVTKDPDEQAQDTVALVFEQFERLGSARQLLRFLVENGIRMPCREITGPRKDELGWRRPNAATVHNMLQNPTYAGAYVYGRRQLDPKKRRPGRPSTGWVVVKPEDWKVLIKDHYPAYITWDRYERNVKQLAANRAVEVGVVRYGPSLLAGLVRCGRCGRRMSVHYSGLGAVLRYWCRYDSQHLGGPQCQSLSGHPLDELVSELVLKGLEPAALEVSLKVAEDVEAERAAVRRHWEQRLERTRYECERAAREYHRAEPENRLVVRVLEREWEKALEAEEVLRQDYNRFLAREPAALSREERDSIRRLAADIPALWSSPTTTDADRQRIVRLLVDEVTVTVVGESEQVEVEIQWHGGHENKTTLIRPVQRLEQLSTYPDLLARAKALHAEGCWSSAQIAQQLTAEGHRSASSRPHIARDTVEILLKHAGVERRGPRKTKWPNGQRPANEWTLLELSRETGIPRLTLYSWVRSGRLVGHRREGDGRGSWIVTADETVLVNLKEHRATERRGRHSNRPTG